MAARTIVAGQGPAVDTAPIIPDPNPNPEPAPIIPDPNPNPQPAPIIPDPNPGPVPEVPDPPSMVVLSGDGRGLHRRRPSAAERHLRLV